MKVFEIDGQNVENELHEKVVEKLNNSGQGSMDTPRDPSHTPADLIIDI